MQIRFILLFFFIFCLCKGGAQQTPLEIKRKAWDIHALRYYPFHYQADSLINQVIGKKQIQSIDINKNYNRKITANLVLNKQFLVDKNNLSTFTQYLTFKYFFLPYNSWLKYAKPLGEESQYLNLTLFLSELSMNKNSRFSAKSPFEIIGSDNIHDYLEDWLGEIDIMKERNDVFFLTIKSPLSENAGKIYRFFFSSLTEIDGVPVYEIAFFSHKKNEKAFEGYLYISVNDLNPVKAVFTLNPSIDKRPAKVALFIQTSSKKQTLLYAGDEITNSLLIEQVNSRNHQQLDSISPDYMAAERNEILDLIEEAHQTRAFSNLQNGVSLLITNHFGVLRNRINCGPVTQMLSYNYMEGARLRIGGFTSQKINKYVSVGGYLAYGTKDNRWKYSGNLTFITRSIDQLRFTYTKDLSIPGQDCLEDNRDRIFYSLNQTRINNLSLKKTGQLSYEINDLNYFSFKISAKYLFEEPLGVIKFETFNNGVNSIIKDITASEIGFFLRFSPKEKKLNIKGKKVVLHSPVIDFRFNHRIGVKGVLGSDFNYNITDISLLKTFNFPLNSGKLKLNITGGKVWNSVPFPLLFIPSGNQSYIYDSQAFNLMRFYEFVTDRFVTGNADLQLNWSPVNLLFRNSKIKMHGGIKTIYGPLSDLNAPQSKPDLFIFNNGVDALREKPYTEVSAGISGILTYIRVDYVYRLTYGKKGSLFFSTNFSF